MSVASETDVVGMTEHALLVPLGQFAQDIGLLTALRRVPLPLKTVQHSPGDKLAAVLVHILSGGMHINAFQTDPHPLVLDQGVAQAWDQEQFASSSGLSALLAAATEESVTVLKRELEGVLAGERQAQLAQLSPAWLVVDFDLTSLVVSDQAQTYEDAGYGYMGERGRVGKGYQFARAQVQGPTGRIQLGGFLHPARTASLECTQELVTLTEATLGRPRRRTELVEQRLAAAQADLATVETQLQETSRWPRQQARREARQAALQAEVTRLAERLGTLQQENAATPHPVRIILRLDGGFGTPATITWLLEQGYDLVVRAHNQQPATRLRAEEGLHWERLSRNSHIAESSSKQLPGCPYPVRLFACRQEASTHHQERWSALIVSSSLAPKDWSVRRIGEFYNGRQEMEAGIKEGKGIFASRHLPTRHHPGIALYQELVLFAQNLLRWFQRQVLARTPLAQEGSKVLVQGAARCRALILQSARSLIICFAAPGRWAGLTLTLDPTCSYQLPFPFVVGSSGDSS